MPVATVVLVSSNSEWRALRGLFDRASVETSPFGEWFVSTMDRFREPLVFMHGGWGKIAAAGSTQYAIDRWRPELIVNLGTCGGFEGEVERGTIILAERTLVYDIFEQMGDYEAHIDHYTTQCDLSWLPEPYPIQVRRALLVSADRDLVPAEIDWLKHRFGAVAGDWESGAIAWVAARNHVRCLILRGVSDLVSSQGGEAYGGNIQVFHTNAESLMRQLVASLPAWLPSQ